MYKTPQGLAPTRILEGIVPIDWYMAAGPANPENWFYNKKELCRASAMSLLLRSLRLLVHVCERRSGHDDEFPC